MGKVFTKDWVEHNVERWVERQIDVLDAKYMLEQITTEEYEKVMNDIKLQADIMYRFHI